MVSFEPPNAKHTFRWTVAIVAGTNVAFFLVTRAALLIQAYRRASLEIKNHETVRDHCLSHADFRAADAAYCHERAMLAESDPFWVAIQEVAEKTRVSCENLFLFVLTQSTSAILYLVLAAISILLLYTVIARITAPLASKAMRPTHYLDEYHSQSIEYAAAGPSIYQPQSYSYRRLEHQPRYRQPHIELLDTSLQTKYR